MAPFLSSSSDSDESLRYLGVLKSGDCFDMLNTLWLFVFWWLFRDLGRPSETAGESCISSSLLQPVLGDHLYLPLVVRTGDLMPELCKTSLTVVSSLSDTSRSSKSNEVLPLVSLLLSVRRLFGLSFYLSGGLRPFMRSIIVIVCC